MAEAVLRAGPVVALGMLGIAAWRAGVRPSELDFWDWAHIAALGACVLASWVV